MTSAWADDAIATRQRRRDPADGLDRAVDERRPVTGVSRDHPVDDGPLDVPFGHRQVQAIAHDPRPGPRVRAHDGRLVVLRPGPAVVGRELGAHLVPPDLRIHEHAVQIEDDRVDQRSAFGGGRSGTGLPRRLALAGAGPDAATTATGALRPSTAS